jgi:hypothetical protein
VRLCSNLLLITKFPHAKLLVCTAYSLGPQSWLKTPVYASMLSRDCQVGHWRNLLHPPAHDGDMIRHVLQAAVFCSGSRCLLCALASHRFSYRAGVLQLLHVTSMARNCSTVGFQGRAKTVATTASQMMLCNQAFSEPSTNTKADIHDVPALPAPAGCLCCACCQPSPPTLWCVCLCLCPAGPYIKWFLEKLGHDGLNKMLGEK